MLDALDACPAMIRTATWDVIAWNQAAAVFTDYGALPPAERNVLRLIFLDPRARMVNPNWESVARFVVGVFRGDAARAGAAATVQPLVDELCAKSPDFATMWRESEVNSACEGVRRLCHPELGEIALVFFGVCGRWPGGPRHAGLHARFSRRCGPDQSALPACRCDPGQWHRS